MADPHILTTLRRKRDDIQAAIEAYGAKIEAAKRDLAAVTSWTASGASSPPMWTLGANQHLRRSIIDENHVCPGVGGMREMHKAAASHSIFVAGSGTAARSARYAGKPWNSKGRWTRGSLRSVSSGRRGWTKATRCCDSPLRSGSCKSFRSPPSAGASGAQGSERASEFGVRLPTASQSDYGRPFRFQLLGEFKPALCYLE
jgi:hypothetical protein